jgi:hypothetical protein
VLEIRLPYLPLLTVIDVGGFRLVDHGVRVATHRLPLAFGTTIAELGKEIRYLAMVLFPLEIDVGRGASVRPNAPGVTCRRAFTAVRLHAFVGPLEY